MQSYADNSEKVSKKQSVNEPAFPEGKAPAQTATSSEARALSAGQNSENGHHSSGKMASDADPADEGADKNENVAAQRDEKDTPRTHGVESYLPLGKTLRDKRLADRLTLSAAANELRTRIEYLKGLESEDYDVIPDPAYVFGFLRSYANYLNLPADDMVAHLRASGKVVVDQQFQAILPAESGRKSGRSLWTVVTVLLLAAAVALGVYVLPGRQTSFTAPFSRETLMDDTLLPEGVKLDDEVAPVLDVEEKTDLNAAPPVKLPATPDIAPQTAPSAKPEAALQPETNAVQPAAMAERVEPMRQPESRVRSEARFLSLSELKQHEALVPQVAARAHGNDKVVAAQALPKGLVLVADGEVWVQVRHSQEGSILLNATLGKGQFLNVSRYLGHMLDVGRPEALSVVLDNRSYGPIGHAGSVLRNLPLNQKDVMKRVSAMSGLDLR